MAVVTTRAGKGSELTSIDYDNTILNLNAELAADTAAITALNTAASAARPVGTGGTGGTSAGAARTNLAVPHTGTSPNHITALWRGTQAEYDALPSKDSTTLYVCTA